MGWTYGEWLFRVAMLVGVYLVDEYAAPPLRHVTNWESYSYPKMADTVSYYSLLALAIGSGMTAIFVVELLSGLLAHNEHAMSAEEERESFGFRNRDKPKLASRINHAMLSFFLGLCAVDLTVELIKHFIGGVRPDYLHRCYGGNIPPLNEIPPIPTCPLNPSANHDGRLSFPSGHAAAAWSAFVWTALYVRTKLALTWEKLPWLQDAVFLLLISPGFYVSATRLIDNRHHVHDIVVGSSLGIVAAFLSWRYYFDFSQKRGRIVTHDGTYTDDKHYNARLGIHESF